MKQHTSQFKQIIPIIGRQLDDFITYGNTTLRNELYSVTTHYEAGLLKSVMKQLDIESSVLIPEGTVVNYQLGLLINGSYEYLDFGKYIVYKVEKLEDKDRYNITCYDKMLYSMIEYKGTPMTFPITINNYIKKLAQLINLPFLSDGVEFTNYNKEILNDPYINAEGNSLGYTIRDIFDELSQVTASNICIGSSNGTEGIEVRYITDTNDTIDENYLKNVNVTFGEKYGPINSIVLSRGAGSDNVYLKDDESITENGLCELKIQDNQIMNDDNRSQYLPGLLSRLDGLEYYINDFSSTGICYYDLCDRYNVQVGETTYSCIMFNDEINRSNGLEETIHTEMPEEAETDYTKADKTDRKINKTNLMVDKQNQQITALVTRTDEFDDTLTQLQIDVNGIETKVEGVYNLTRKASGTKTMLLENCMKGYILELHIYGNNTVFDYLYPANDLYPADDLYPKGDSRITVTDKDGNVTPYELHIMDVLRANEETYDEYILKDNYAQVIRRVNADGTTKETEVIENIGKYTIYVEEGDNTIQIKNYSAKLDATYIIKNSYTDQFTTQIQTQSKIEQASNQIMLEVSETYETQNDANENYSRLTQTANEITTEVSKKVGKDEVISRINQSAEAVTINANKISLAGKNINLSADNVSITSNKLDISDEGTITVKGGSNTGNVNGLYIRAIDPSDSNIYTGMAPDFFVVKRSGTHYIAAQTAASSNYARFNISSDAYNYIASTATSSGGTILVHSSSSDTQISDWGIITPQVTQTSKAEQKKNFEKLTPEQALQIILSTDIYKYNLKLEQDGKKKHIGFIIGKDYKYSSDITAEDNEGKEIGVDNYSMTSATYGAIQYLYSQIKIQQQQIEQLQNELKLMKGEKNG